MIQHIKLLELHGILMYSGGYSPGVDILSDRNPWNVKDVSVVDK